MELCRDFDGQDAGAMPEAPAPEGRLREGALASIGEVCRTQAIIVGTESEVPVWHECRAESAER